MDREKDSFESEAARLLALEEYDILDTAAEEAFDRLTKLASTFYQSPIALVSLIDRDRQWFKSRLGLAASETPRDIAFCHHAIQEDKPFIVPDASKDDRFANNPLVTGDPDIRFYAGAPLKTPEGYKIGTLCIIDREPRPEFKEQDAEQLSMLADVVINEMELRIKNARLEKALAELEKADKSRSHFLATVSHEIKTPLSGIVGLAQVLDDHDLSAESSLIVKGIQSSSFILQGLLNDILDYAKIEAGRIQLRSTNIGLKGYIANIGQAWQLLAADKGLAFDTRVSDNLPETVEMDELRVGQIINNLLSNAVKFTDAGMIKIDVKNVSSSDPEVAMIAISVSDTGRGMSKDEQSRLFKPFEQANAEIAHRYGGTGLGMAISANLAELLGGTIVCESELDKGTCFTLSLPLKIVQPANEVAKGSADCTSDLSRKVLVVDDVSVNRIMA
ncbi:MAG: ATP-binding protein, partial [Alphaproteobacteria bacterium]|nr:ATP-binding protein [Alphaproteobacteria bacterium]